MQHTWRGFFFAADKLVMLNFLYLMCTLCSLFVIQAIKGKYSTSKQMKIATISQLRSSLVKDLAKQLTQWDDKYLGTMC